MAACDHKNRCPECGDRLIHQNNRGMHESSSGYGQYLHDKHGNVFWLMDIDLIIYKRATKILRIGEQKPLRGSPRPSQRFLLPLLAVGLKTLVMVGVLHRQSGVFVIFADPPFEGGITVREVEPILGSVLFSLGPEIVLNGATRTKFETGLDLTEHELAATA